MYQKPYTCTEINVLSVKASGALPQTPLGELTALPQTP